MILNNKILLRAIERDDLTLITKWRNDPYIQPFVREYREMTLERVVEWYNKITGSDNYEFFMIEYDGRRVGIVGLSPIDWKNRRAEISIAVYDESVWCDNIIAPNVLRIIIKHSFHTLNLEKVYAEVYSFDDKKQELFIDGGFTEDGVLRDHYYHYGTYYNSHIYSLLKNKK